MVANRNKKPAKTDLILLGLTLALTCIGVLLVFDASYAYALQRHISEYKYVDLQAAWGGIGVIALLIMLKIPYWWWRNVAIFGVAASLILLAAVFVPHIGIAAKGAHRWVGHGELRLQPSELAKLAAVLYVAYVCAGRRKQMKDFWTGSFPPLCVVCLLAALTAREPDLGTALVIFFAGLTTLLLAGMRVRHLLAVLACLVLVGGMAVVVSGLRHHYQWSRITVFLHPDQDPQGDGYQIYHSKIALGSGGIFGMGIGEGREKTYLPEAHTDFIFSVLGEEGGLIMGLALLTLFAVLVARGLQIAYNCTDSFGALLAAGVASTIGIQSLINVGVVTASIPATGVPLPLISYGGSSLVLTLMGIGLLLNIARHPEGNPANKEDSRLQAAERQFDRRWDRHAAPASASVAHKRARGRKPATSRPV